MSAKLFSEVVFCNQCNLTGPAHDHLGHDTAGFGGRLRFCPCCLDVFYVQRNCVSWSSLCCDSCNRKADETDDREFLARYDRAEMRKRAYYKYKSINNKVVRLVVREEARFQSAIRRAEKAVSMMAAEGRPGPYIRGLKPSYLPGEYCGGSGKWCMYCNDCRKCLYILGGDGYKVFIFKDTIQITKFVRDPGQNVGEDRIVFDDLVGEVAK